MEDLLNNPTFAAIAGVVVGVVLTKVVELVQIQNRRLKRASKPKYKVESFYDASKYSTILLEYDGDEWELKVSIADLLENAATELVSFKPVFGGYLSKYQGLDLRDENYFIKLRARDVNDFFALRLVYFSSGFRYNDFWLGRLVKDGSSSEGAIGYNVEFEGPMSKWQYYYFLVLNFKKCIRVFFCRNC